MYGFASAGRTTSAMPASATTFRRPVSAATAPLDPPHRAGPEKPRGADDQHEHDDEERRDVGEARVKVAAGEVLDEADAEAAEDGAGEAAEPAEDGRREGLDEERAADVGIDERERGHEHGRRRAGRRPGRPRDRVDAIAADAGKPRGLRVLGGGPQHLARARPREEHP